MASGSDGQPPARVRDAADELYAVPIEQFTPRRKELVAAAKQDKDLGAARLIQAFGKPTRSAWTINQLARVQPELIDGLAEVGQALREAQDALDGERMRELSGQRRRVIDEIARAAYRVTDNPEPSPAIRDEVSSTLTAALLDEAVLGAVRSGTLVRAAEASGFGAASGPGLAAVPDLVRNRPVPARKATQSATTSAARAAATKSAATPGGDAEARRERAAREKREQQEQRRAEREQALTDAQDEVGRAEQAEADQRETARILAEQLADARRILGERELDTRRATRALQRARNQKR